MFPKTVFGLKQELRALSGQIQAGRQVLREEQRKCSKGTGDWDCMKGIQSNLLSDRAEYRHKHIVLCLLRGRARERIETPRETNKPNEKKIETLLALYTPKGAQDEALRHCSN